MNLKVHPIDLPQRRRSIISQCCNKVHRVPLIKSKEKETEDCSLPPATKLGQGNIFRSVCQQFCPRGGMCGCSGGGGVRGFIWGNAWFYSGGVHGFIRGAYMVLFGGACMVLFSRGGMHGFFGYNEIRSMSGRYASYWNAFLFLLGAHCSIVNRMLVLTE